MGCDAEIGGDEQPLFQLMASVAAPAAAEVRHAAGALGLEPEAVAQRVAEDWLELRAILRASSLAGTHRIGPAGFADRCDASARRPGDAPTGPTGPAEDETPADWASLPPRFFSALLTLDDEAVTCRFVASARLVCQPWAARLMRCAPEACPALDRDPRGCMASLASAVQTLAASCTRPDGFDTTGTESFLGALSSCHSLTSLDLSRLRRGLSDAQLQRLCHLTPCLRSLTFSVKRPRPHHQVTATAGPIGKLLSHLEQLTQLTICCDLFRPAGPGEADPGRLGLEALSLLHTHRSLRSVTLRRCTFPAGCDRVDLSGFHSLHGLSLVTSDQIHEEGLRLPNSLGRLSIDCPKPRRGQLPARLDPDLVHQLAQDCPSLQALELKGLWLDEPCAEAIRLSLGNLCSLALLNCQHSVPNAGGQRAEGSWIVCLVPLLSASRLTRLDLGSALAGGVESLGPVPTSLCQASPCLRHMGLEGQMCTEDTLGRLLAHLSGLSSLHLTNQRALSPLFAPQLFQLTGLLRLKLQRSLRAFSGPAVEKLLGQLSDGLPLLTSLDISENEAVSLQRLPPLKALHTLRQLRLKDTPAIMQTHQLAFGREMDPPKRLETMLWWAQSLPVLLRSPEFTCSAASVALPALRHLLDPESKIWLEFS